MRSIWAKAAVLAGVVWAAASSALAGVVTYESETEAGTSVLIEMRYDDADVRDRLRFRRNQTDLADYFGLTVTVNGIAYDLSDPSAGTLTFDRRSGTLAYIASDAALGAGSPTQSFTLFFGGRLKIRRFSDLLSVMFAMTPEEIEVFLDEAIVTAVPIPPAALLFAPGLTMLCRARRVARSA